MHFFKLFSERLKESERLKLATIEEEISLFF